MDALYEPVSLEVSLSFLPLLLPLLLLHPLKLFTIAHILHVLVEVHLHVTGSTEALSWPYQPLRLHAESSLLHFVDRFPFLPAGLLLLYLFLLLLAGSLSTRVA